MTWADHRVKLFEEPRGYCVKEVSDGGKAGANNEEVGFDAAVELSKNSRGQMEIKTYIHRTVGAETHVLSGLPLAAMSTISLAMDVSVVRPPIANINISPAFLILDICNPATIGIGTMRIKRSVATPMAAFDSNNIVESIHLDCPSYSISQLARTGIHGTAEKMKSVTLVDTTTNSLK